MSAKHDRRPRPLTPQAVQLSFFADTSVSDDEQLVANRNSHEVATPIDDNGGQVISSRQKTAVSHVPRSEAISGVPKLVTKVADSPGIVSAPRALPERLQPAIEEYLEYLMALNRSKHTRESFALDLKLLHIYLGNPPLSAIGERDLRGFVHHVRVERRNSSTSVRRKIASLKNFFAYLHRERIIAADPSLHLVYPEIFPALPEYLEEQQVAALLAAAAEHKSWLALVALMLDTGLKRDEIVALGLTDVRLSPLEEGEHYLVVRETEQSKRLRSRRLEISVDTAAVLRAHLLEHAGTERFFDFSPRGVNFIVETCGKRAHIITRGPRLTPQTLRETFAVRHMREMVRLEDRARDAGSLQEELNALMERHDRELLRLLGLFEEPESARKYRKLVRGWTANAQPPAVQ